MFSEIEQNSENNVGKRPQIRGCNPLLSKFAAFTLSEVLITLGIIGIVASLTIPHLIQSQHERQTVVAVRKAYSTLSSAFTLAVQENGTPENWGLTDSYPSPVGAGIMLSKLSPYLNITENCGTENGCFIDKKYLGLNNTDGMNFYSNNSFAKVSLADGSNIGMIVTDANCSVQRGSSAGLNEICGDIWVDINGQKAPNQYGVDMFLFWISRTGITPFGTQQATNYAFRTYCRKSNTTLFENGAGCAAWVLYKENMDYLHCNNLSWTGKSTCN